MSINPNNLNPDPISDSVLGAAPQKVKPVDQTDIDNLPPDVLRLIFGLVGDSNKLSQAFVNKKFNAIVKEAVKDPKVKEAFKDRVMSELNKGKRDLFEWAILNIGFTVKYTHELRSGVWTDALYNFVENNKLDVIKKLNLTNPNNEDINSLYQAAAKFGRVEILNWLHAQGYQPNASSHETNPFNELVSTAEVYGKPEVLQWLLDKGNVTVDAGGKSEGKPELIKWIIKNYPVLNYYFISGLVSSNEIEILKSIPLEKITPAILVGIGNAAARSGNIPILEWAKTLGLEPNPSLCRRAVDGGQLEALKWVTTFGSEFPKDLLWHAAQTCDVTILRWLDENGCVYEKTSDIVANIITSDKDGKFEALKWAVEKGFPWPMNARYLAGYVSTAMDQTTYDWILANTPEEPPQ